ncbi:hypothetical protein ADL22_12500 [Streptomyces sp. NRRL F-4489]|nr:hypothetical protein ADL22_12500 [Streptomyces sp. NRRL F-4489]
MVYRDRQGTEITPDEWAALWNDMTYRAVASSAPSHGVLVRTVWEGVDDATGVGCMFATGVSRDGGSTWSTECEDARTEGDALVQHGEVETMWGSGRSSA